MEKRLIIIFGIILVVLFLMNKSCIFSGLREMSRLEVPLKEKRVVARKAANEYKQLLNKKEWYRIKCDTLFPRHNFEYRAPFIDFYVWRTDWNIFIFKSKPLDKDILKNLRIHKKEVNGDEMVSSSVDFISAKLNYTDGFDSIIPKINIDYNGILLRKTFVGDSILDLNFLIKQLGIDLNADPHNNELVFTDNNLGILIPALKKPHDKTNIFLRLLKRKSNLYFIFIVHGQHNGILNPYWIHRFLNTHADTSKT